MPADIDEILECCRGLDPAAVRTMVARFDADYLQRFAPDRMAAHLGGLLSLSAAETSRVMLESLPDGAVACTVMAFDHPFEFSIIAGAMAATGLSIASGDAFTLPAPPPAVRGRRAGARATRGSLRDPQRRGLILDVFRGQLAKGQRFPAWSAQLEPLLLEALRLLDGDEPGCADLAKRLVNERVTEWMMARRRQQRRAGLPPPAMPHAPDINLEQLGDRTRLHIAAPDAPGFLYTLSTALSLHGLLIRGLAVRTVEGRAVDRIDFVDSSGAPVENAGRLEHIRFSATLTHQFASFLDRAPDPFTALVRFEELTGKVIELPQRQRWAQLLADPRTMSDLARLLGASDFLWEDFLRHHAEVLLPLLRRHVEGRSIYPPERTLPRRLAGALRAGGTIAPAEFDRQRQRLNEFKDRELLLIDLDHILSAENSDAGFQRLSERLVLLAENIVAAAAALAGTELLRLYGQPLDDRGAEANYAVFGLGKLGGVALGYASDIELLFLFDRSGRTAGGVRGRLGNDEFVAILARETCQAIRTKREGIFQIDLRLRPHGNDGPLACSESEFERYYGPGGPASAFERLALGRLRWIAGSPRLGFAIEQLRDRLLYDGPPLATDELWDVWSKMHQQHVTPGTLNSKYSPGGLADLEGAVQLLQVRHARAAPQLRTPRLGEALEGLRRAGILTPEEFEEVVAAYHFIRRLINAQRMLRGSARDLEIPPAGSDELLHLARRMGLEMPGPALLRQAQAHMAAVREFMARHFDRPEPQGQL
ncbi:MAG: hypothetical protein ACHRHE_12210 [Tepidisphaerales bacterium]